MAKKVRNILTYDVEDTLGDDIIIAITWKDSSVLVTVASHDKDSNDLDTLWETPDAVRLVLAEIVSSTKLRFYRYDKVEEDACGDPIVTDIPTTGTLLHVQGATHTTTVTYTATFENPPRDFTTSSALAQIKVAKTDTTEVDHFDVTLGDSVGNLTMRLPSARSELLTPDLKYYWDLEITDATSLVRTYIEGTFKLIQDTSRA